VPAIYSRGKGGIPAGVEHAKLVRAAVMEVLPARSKWRRCVLLLYGMWRAVMRWSESRAVAGTSGGARWPTARGGDGAVEVMARAGCIFYVANINFRCCRCEVSM
jgi:hypothetical protein